jgi:hypothetical protein
VKEKQLIDPKMVGVGGRMNIKGKEKGL